MHADLKLWVDLRQTFFTLHKIKIPENGNITYTNNVEIIKKDFLEREACVEKIDSLYY